MLQYAPSQRIIIAAQQLNWASLCHLLCNPNPNFHWDGKDTKTQASGLGLGLGLHNKWQSEAQFNCCAAIIICWEGAYCGISEKVPTLLKWLLPASITIWNLSQAMCIGFCFFVWFLHCCYLKDVALNIEISRVRSLSRFLCRAQQGAFDISAGQ